MIQKFTIGEKGHYYIVAPMIKINAGGWFEGPHHLEGQAGDLIECDIATYGQEPLQGELVIKLKA